MASHRSIHRETTQMSCEHLCQEISNALDMRVPDSEKQLIIPDHQRHAGIWPINRKKKFITSIHQNHPIPSILMGSTINRVVYTLEDGLQRLNTLLDFLQNRITDNENRLFSEYTEREQSNFLNYSITVMKYSGATEDERIQIFDNHQNGSPLKEGERLYAHSATRLVSFTLRTLLTQGAGLYDRFLPVWGARGGEKDKKNRRKDLHQAVGLVAGIVHGPKFLTKKYDVMIEECLLTKEFDEALPITVLMRLLEVYERVQEQCPCPASWLNKQFDAGQMSGYIVYSMYHANGDSINNDLEWKTMKEKWIAFLISVRLIAGQKSKNMNKILERDLHRDVGKARVWILSRWRLGYLRVFDPTHQELLNLQEMSEEDTDED